MRFYELDAGRITLDGVDIATMRARRPARRIGMVLQDTWLFGGTIRDNIAYGRPDATEEEILAAARATYVDRFVRSAARRVRHRHRRRGQQRQRRGEAADHHRAGVPGRAVAADPGRGHQLGRHPHRGAACSRRWPRCARDRTSFVIAHRLSTIRDADLILVMEDGRIVEQGTHDELLAAHGAYYALYKAQFAAAAL